MEGNMFPRTIRFTLVFLLLIGCVTLLGCKMGIVHVLIPDFESAQVQGIQVYRQTTENGHWNLEETLFFRLPTEQNGEDEILKYVLDPEQESAVLNSVVLRDPDNPDRVEVQLIFQVQEFHGKIRVGSFNQKGPSNLSVDHQVLTKS